MNNAIKAMRYAGVSLAMFRKLNKQERILLWMMVVATCEW